MATSCTSLFPSLNVILEAKLLAMSPACMLLTVMLSGLVSCVVPLTSTIAPVVKRMMFDAGWMVGGVRSTMIGIS